jgi:hypothetical protein
MSAAQLYPESPSELSLTPTTRTVGNVTTSGKIDQLAAALCSAQGEITGALKDSTNPHFRSSYADLASVWAACRPQLTKHGLSVVQMPVTVGDQVGISNMLLHKSGQWIQSEMLIKPTQPQNPQVVGSILTYFRRYMLAGTAGVPQVDDDGNAAAAVSPKDAGVAPTQEESPQGITFTGEVTEVSFTKNKNGDEMVWLQVQDGDQVRRVYRHKSMCSPSLYRREEGTDAYEIQGQTWQFVVDEPEQIGDKTVHRLQLASRVTKGKKK